MLGERVVLSLCKSIRDRRVAIACDRYFSSPQLFCRSAVPLVGTYMSNRKFTPKVLHDRKLEKKNDFDFSSSNKGLLAIKWKDNKDVLVMSNCHLPHIGETLRRQQDGSKEKVFCPTAILDYNLIMGGTDRCDQMASLYSYGRKSSKWWKKVFFRLFRITTINSWIISSKLQGKKPPFFVFLMELAHEMIQEAAIRRDYVPGRKRGRPSKLDRLVLDPVGNHMIVCANKKGRWRCVQCAKRKKESRVPFLCKSCNVPLCPACFVDYHKDLQSSMNQTFSDDDLDEPPEPNPVPAPPDLVDLCGGPSKTSSTPSTRITLRTRKQKVVQVSTFEEKTNRIAKKHNLTKDVAMSVIESAKLKKTKNVLPLPDWDQDPN